MHKCAFGILSVVGMVAGALRFGRRRLRLHAMGREHDIARVAANRLPVHEHMRDIAVEVDASGSDFEQASGFLSLPLKRIGRVRMSFSQCRSWQPV